MFRRWAYMLLAAGILVTAPGCNYKQLVQQSTQDYGSRKPGDPKALGARAYGPLSANPDQHDNAFFEYSSALSRKISDLDGISSAFVMLTDKNAYVGLVLDWTAVGTKGTGGTDEQNNSGMTEGIYNADTGNNFGNNRVLVTPYNSYYSVNDHHNLSHELKQTVALAVRDLAPAVQEVHISANMELVNYFGEFAKEAWGGRPLSPWTDAFNTVVQYHFGGGNVMPEPITQPGQDAPYSVQRLRREATRHSN